MVSASEAPSLAGLLPTFRDPSGSLSFRGDSVDRVIEPDAEADLLAFLQGDLANALTAEGLLIGTAVAERSGGKLTLRHGRVPFIAYPWEWPAAMWQAAGDLTLHLCERLLAEGWILKDATPLNVLFHRGKPVFVDLPSVQRLHPSQPLWFAYAQFLRTFVFPLLAHARLGWDLRATQVRRDGYEAGELAEAMPWTARLRPMIFGSVILPAMLERRSGGPRPRQSTRQTDEHPPKEVDRRARPFTGDEEQCRYILGRALAGLRKRLQAAAGKRRESSWSGYSAALAHYPEADRLRKREFVRETLRAIGPRRVLDVGCNVGAYSAMAAEAGAEVVAIDTDEASLSELYRHNAGRLDILPLHVDLARPTPSTGWANRETASFLDRAAGHFDTVMMLAVIHHMLLADQIPMRSIAELCGRLTTRDLILEWVPPSDPMFRALVRGRDALYAPIQECAMREAFAPLFTTVSEVKLENGRSLLHLRRHRA